MKTAGCLAAFFAALVTFPMFAAAPGRLVSGDYQLLVDGMRTEVIRVPKPENRLSGKDAEPYSYAAFEATNEVVITVRSSLFDLGRAPILPESKGVKPISASRSEMVFRMKPATTLVIEPNGRHRALVLSANLPEADPPREGEPKVKYFGAGFHHVGLITLADDETLYLAPGAWVEGFLLGRGRNLKVRGGGVLSGASWDWHKGPKESQSFNESGTLVTMSGEGIDFRDVTLFSSWGWTLVMNNVTNAVIDNVKVVCGRVINDDGIDICRAKDVVVRNSFVRCQDDCITPKYWCENLVVSNCIVWTDAANAFRTGYECESRESGLAYRNLLFKDIDVLHLTIQKTHPEKYWANCAIYIQPAHGQTMYSTVYDDIRFHEVGPMDIFLNVKTMPITQGSRFCRTDEAGYLDGLIIRNIHLPDSRGGMCVNLQEHDAEHTIRGVRFENVTGYGRVTKSAGVTFEH